MRYKTFKEIDMLLDQIFDMINSGIIIIEKSFIINNINRWVEIHGRISSEEIIGKHFFEVFPGKPAKRGLQWTSSGRKGKK